MYPSDLVAIRNETIGYVNRGGLGGSGNYDLKDAIIKGLGIQSGNLNLFGFDLKGALVAQSLECDLQADNNILTIKFFRRFWDFCLSWRSMMEMVGSLAVKLLGKTLRSALKVFDKMSKRSSFAEKFKKNEKLEILYMQYRSTKI
ncbi:hypothetical protein LXL04_017964 [Taraxacum kok-saghyz]